MKRIVFSISLARLLPAFVFFSRCSILTAQYVRQTIVGGTEITDSSAYPFLAFSSGSQLCGASLIWSDILLSAGHCSNAFLNGGLFIGGILLSGADGEFHLVDQVLVHPNYPVISTEPHDIMLIKIGTMSSKQPVPLATNMDLPVEGFTVKVLGFGKTVDNGAVSQIAKEVDLNVVNFPACDELYGGKLIDAQFCADGNGDSCQGDSGGPLLNLNGEQVGIVSFGEGCDQYPSVNTRVSYYSEWIQQGICSLSSSPPTNCFAETTTSTPITSPIQPPPIPQTYIPTFIPTRPPTMSPMTAPPLMVTTQAPITNFPISTLPPTATRSDPPSLLPTKLSSENPTSFPTTLVPSSVVETPTTIVPSTSNGNQTALQSSDSNTSTDVLQGTDGPSIAPAPSSWGTSVNPSCQKMLLPLVFLCIIGLTS